MTLDQILVFKEISKEGTLRAAAEVLRLSQPALSASLKKLESSIGFQLYDRSLYRPQLTEQGRRFLKGVDAFLEAHTSLCELAEDLRGDCEASLRIALDSACPFELIIPKIQEAVVDLRSLELDFRFGVVTQSMQQLLDGEVDLAIGPLLSLNEKIESRPLLKRRLIPAIHKRHLPEGRSIFELRELKNIPNIVVSSGQRDNPFGVPGLKGGKTIHVSNHAVKEQLIQMGIGWGRISEERLLSRPYADDLIEIRRKELPPVELEIGVMWRRAESLGRAARRVREKLGELAL